MCFSFSRNLPYLLMQKFDVNMFDQVLEFNFSMSSLSFEYVLNTCLHFQLSIASNTCLHSQFSMVLNTSLHIQLNVLNACLQFQMINVSSIHPHFQLSIVYISCLQFQFFQYREEGGPASETVPYEILNTFKQPFILQQLK